jgi:hypothetical protein
MRARRFGPMRFHRARAAPAAPLRIKESPSNSDVSPEV